MRKIFLVSLIIGLLFFSSCSKEETTTIPQANDKINASEINQEVNGYGIKKIDFKLEKDCYFSTIKWINDDNLLLIVSNYQNGGEDKYHYSKIYHLKTNDMSTKEIYNGILYGDPITVRLKVMKDDSLGLIGYNTFLLFDKETLNLQKVTQFPVDKFSYDISYDGKSITYLDSKGALYFSNIDFTNPVLLQDTDERPSSLIRWSPNDQNILFSSFFDENKLCVIDPKAKKLKQFIFINSDLLMGHWFSDANRILAYSNTGKEHSISYLTILDINKGEISKFEIEGNPSILENQSNGILLYKNEEENTKSASDIYYLNLLDLNTQSNTRITPGYYDIISWAGSPSGESFAYIGQTDPNNIDLFVAKKKN